MTNKKFAGHQVDTDPFRKAIWNYSEYVFGFIYSNYDYGEVLEKNSKYFFNFSLLDK